MDFSAPFATWLKQRRKALGMTRSTLAGRINYSIETLHKVEGGALKPSRMLAEQLVEPLEIPDAQRDAFIMFATGVDARARADNLPAPVDRLIGRESALVAAHRLLRSKDARLITFIGPPGVGKTRLALQAAWDMRDHFANGAWFVPLEMVNEPGLVPLAIAHAAGIPIIEFNVLESIKQHFCDQHALLLLDNFEHVLEAAPAVAHILSAAPNVKIVVTSRAALHLAGEHLFIVEGLNDESAVMLFEQRAEAMRPNISLDGNKGAIVEICRRLDGLPLAIELAAARMRLFDPQQLLARMDSPLSLLSIHHRDAMLHQRTLRETMAESERLLSSEEAAAFRRLGIFVGGCSLPAAEDVLRKELIQPVINLVQALADHSLIRVDPQPDAPRISMLQTIREYALERLHASGEYDAIARQHAECYTDIAELCEADMPDAQLRKFNEESGNLRAALAYAREKEDALMQMRLLASFGQWPGLLWQPKDVDWLVELFALPATHAPALKRIRARALSAAGFHVLFLMDEGWLHAQAMLEESAQLFETLGDVTAQANSLAKLACILWNTSDIKGCIDTSRRVLKLNDGKGLQYSSAMANGLIAGALRDQGDYAGAIQRFKLSIEQFEALGDASMATFQYNGLGDLEFNRGRLDEARVCYEHALVSWQAGGSEGEVARRGLGRVAYVQGDLQHAHELLQQAVTLQRQWGNRADQSFTLHHLAWVNYLAGDPDAASLLDEALHLQLQRKCILGIIESLDRCAWMAADCGDFARAAQLFGAAEGLRHSLGMVFPEGDKPIYDVYFAKAQAGLNTAAFDAAWVVGKAMRIEDAVTFALSSIAG